MGMTRKPVNNQAIFDEARANAERKFRNAARDRTSFMSNAKWRRVFLVLDAFTVDHRALGTRTKFLESEQEYSERVPRPSDLGERWVYEGRTQPFQYRRIEWLDVVTKDPNGVMAALSNAGRFEIESLPDGLRIYGYR